MSVCTGCWYLANAVQVFDLVQQSKKDWMGVAGQLGTCGLQQMLGCFSYNASLGRKDIKKLNMLFFIHLFRQSVQ